MANQEITDVLKTPEADKAIKSVLRRFNPLDLYTAYLTQERDKKFYEYEIPTRNLSWSDYGRGYIEPRFEFEDGKSVRMLPEEVELWDKLFGIKGIVDEAAQRLRLYVPIINLKEGQNPADYFSFSSDFSENVPEGVENGAKVSLGRNIYPYNPILVKLNHYVPDSPEFFINVNIGRVTNKQSSTPGVDAIVQMYIHLIDTQRPVLSVNSLDDPTYFSPFTTHYASLSFYGNRKIDVNQARFRDFRDRNTSYSYASFPFGKWNSEVIVPQDEGLRLFLWQMSKFMKPHDGRLSLEGLLQMEPRQTAMEQYLDELEKERKKGPIRLLD